MKTRQGFVSNSSSSSFCIMGVVIDRDTHTKIDEAEGKKETTLITKYGIDSYYEEYLAGFDVESMKPDETLAQFKGRCAQELAKFGIFEMPSWCLDGGRDG